MHAALPVVAAAPAVGHSPEQPRAGEPVLITCRVAGDPPRVVTLQWQPVDPGKYLALPDPAYKTNWLALPMNDAGRDGDAVVGDGVYSARVPPETQIHRRLVRYRIAVTDSVGRAALRPPADDPQPNYAYFVYNGVPGWRGAIDPGSSDPKKREPIMFRAEAMRRVQVYHLIAARKAIENVTWHERSGGKEYKYTGTLVADGRAYDHIRFRIRGGVWRYAMGKNMWKIDFNRGHYLQARDNYRQPYQTEWGKLNLRACIQQGDYEHRGEQGMFEAVGFKLFNLAGVEAPHTHWVHLRIIDGAEENPADQYRGDFWGLYLAIENEDGQFLKEHHLPDGNLYKMMMGAGELSHQGANAVTNGADLAQFMLGYRRGNPTEAWWREQLDLPRYYSYRSILEAIHHYDVEEGKNYDFYFNPASRKWSVLPWDIDLTWADNMYGGGHEPFLRILSRPAFNAEYQNRLREIRDLLFNSEQTPRLIDEYAALIAEPSGKPSLVDADRAKWDYHPIMNSRYVLRGKAGQGLFYQASPTRDFAGMTQLMKQYVKRRSAYIDRTLLNDSNIPPTPRIEPQGQVRVLTNQLRFQAAISPGLIGVAGSKWRIGAVTPPKTSPANEPARYEITAAWESEEFPQFQNEITIPASAVQPGQAYRVRVRAKGQNGMWSHWSAPVEFTAAGAAGEK